MKRTGVLIISLLVSLGCFAQTAELRAYYQSARFFHPETGPYFETYLTVIGNSIVYKRLNDGMLQGQVEYLVLIKKDTSIVDFRKIRLESPPAVESDSTRSNFIDQQRFALPNGRYTLEFSIRDLHTSNKPLTATQDVEIQFPDSLPRFSGVQFIESYRKTEKENILTKHGMDLKPYVSDFFPSSMNDLVFYCELYHTDRFLGAGKDYLLRYHIESAETGKVLSEFSGFTREKASPIKVVLKSINIEKLPSGNFHLVLEARDRENKIMDQVRVGFQRSNLAIAYQPTNIQAIDISGTFLNSVNHPDTIKDYLLCLVPIAEVQQREFIVNLAKKGVKDQVLQKQFIYNFWLERNPSNPEGEWKRYQEVVKKVQREFGYFAFRGYQTDRGRVYLQYGPPDIRTESKLEPGMNSVNGPYEIWHYYQAGNQPDVKFIFVNESNNGLDYTLTSTNKTGETMNTNIRKSDLYQEESQGNRFYKNLLDPK